MPERKVNVSKQSEAERELLLEGACSVILDQIPLCPQCGRDWLRPDYGINYDDESGEIRACVMFACQGPIFGEGARTIGVCSGILVARYAIDKLRPRQVAKLLPGPPTHYFAPREFEAPIPAVSKKFCEIYNEAKHAEDCGLLLVCGAGYRKALEFLVKDYLVRHKFVGDPRSANLVTAAPLAFCIENYIDDKGIQKAAHRAAWLGNDETHYVRKWTGKDLGDLKQLIDIAVAWIALSVRLSGHVKSMPKP